MGVVERIPLGTVLGIILRVAYRIIMQKALAIGIVRGIVLENVFGFLLVIVKGAIVEQTSLEHTSQRNFTYPDTSFQ